MCLFSLATLEMHGVHGFTASPNQGFSHGQIRHISSLRVSTYSPEVHHLHLQPEGRKKRKKKVTSKRKKVSGESGKTPQQKPSSILPPRRKIMVTSDSLRRQKYGLSKDEEKILSGHIRRFRFCVRIRDELSSQRFDDGESSFQQPTEEEWANACGTSVEDLRRIMVDGQDARSRIVEANGGLVGSIAKRYHTPVQLANQANNGVGSILSYSDLIQEGNLGLMEAAEKFDPDRGFRFSTYASWCVRGRMLKAVNDYSRIIRLPANVHNMMGKMRKAKNSMETEMGRLPTEEEVAFRLGVSTDKVRQCNDAMRTVVSLEQPIRGNSRKPDAGERPSTIGQFLSADSPSPEEEAENQSLRETLLSIVGGLKAMERDVLIARYGLDNGSPMTIEETSKRLGISIDRVRMVEARALNKLRNPQTNHKLKPYVEAGAIDESDTEEFVGLTPEQMWSL